MFVVVFVGFFCLFVFFVLFCFSNLEGKFRPFL